MKFFQQLSAKARENHIFVWRIFVLILLICSISFFGGFWLLDKIYGSNPPDILVGVITFTFFFSGSLNGLIIAIMQEYPRFPVHIHGKPARILGVMIFILGMGFSIWSVYAILMAK